MTDTRYVHTLDRVSILPIDNGNYAANRISVDRDLGYRLNLLADIVSLTEVSNIRSQIENAGTLQNNREKKERERESI